jgi:hydroxymethylglutaryl-CoA synthase
MRASHMAHSYDFFKPNLSSPYPVVDGKGSAMCYLRSLDLCYRRLCDKRKALLNADTSLDSFDFVVCHAPYNKLVQKSFGRLLYNDYLRAGTDNARFATVNPALRNLPSEESLESAEVEKTFVALSKADYARMVAPGTMVPVQVGNVYTCSMFAGLLSLIVSQGGALAGKRLLAFAYGSGLASSIYTFRVADDAATALDKMKQNADIESRLAARRAIAPDAFNEMMQKREALHHSDGGFEPADSIATLFPGTFYLLKKDDSGRRTYAQTSL